ncbi:MAG TPA: GspH/FimT family pseudopilin [Usitatibacter sp.]|nr:GspH/FimT family pseudopilin [Usitatibacter sp.]
MRRMRMRGFTLVEVFVSLAIVAMLLLFAAPNVATWIQNTRLRSAAESVASCLQNARLEAMKRNTYVACMMTDPASSAWQVCVYDPVNLACQAATPIILQRYASEDAGITSLGVDTTASNSSVALAPGNNMPGQAVFDSFGRLPSTFANQVMRIDTRNASILQSDERRLVIYINVGGQIRMCDPKLSKATNPMGCQ